MKLAYQPSKLSFCEILQNNTIFEITEPLTFFRKRQFEYKKLYQIISSIILIISGLLIQFLLDEDPSIDSIIGTCIFTGSMIPFFNSIISILKAGKLFIIKNIIKLITSSFLMAIAIGILFYYKSNSNEFIWKDFYLNCGATLFEAGLFLILTDLFWLQDDNEWIINELTKEIKRIQNSAGTGLALSYFFNFIKPSFNSINTNSSFEIMKGGKVQIINCNKNMKIIILIPRILKSDDLKIFLNELKNKEIIFEGKQISKKPGFRTFSYFLRISKINQVLNVIDVPTIISSIFARNKMESNSLDNEVQRKLIENSEIKNIEEFYNERMINEIIEFEKCLLNLLNLKENEFCKKSIKLISVPAFENISNWNVIFDSINYNTE